MITFFSIPKPCAGHIGVIQRNAVLSWSKLAGKLGAQVVLLGEESGVAELAAEAGAAHVPTVARNAHGTPLVDDLFTRAEAAARPGDLLCYINADIVLLDDFADAARRLARAKRKFLMVGQRWDAPVTDPIVFDDKWQAKLRDLAAAKGSLHKPTGIDYFLYSRGLFGRVPPFAVGRTAWDNWLIYRARSLKAPVVDATGAVLAIHQNHDYAHGGGFKQVWKGEEAKLNFELAGGQSHIFTIWDASHKLDAAGLHPNTRHSLGGGIWNYRRSAQFGVG